MTYQPASYAAVVGEEHQGASNGGEQANRVTGFGERSRLFWLSGRCVGRVMAGPATVAVVALKELGDGAPTPS